MRLTERKTIYPTCDNNGNLIGVECIEVKDKDSAEEKLCQLEDILEKNNIEKLEELDDLLWYAKKIKDIEEELGVNLITLVSKKFKESYDLEINKHNKKIFFCGDSYYGDWTKTHWLDFIRDAIAAYRVLVKLGN